MTYDWKPSLSDEAAIAPSKLRMFGEEPQSAERMSRPHRGEPSEVMNTAKRAALGRVIEASASSNAGDPIVDLVNDGGMAEERARSVSAAVRVAKAIVFIDPGIADISTIVQAASTDAEIVLLDDSSDGLEQIAGYLRGQSGITAVHMVGPGGPGELHLGCAALTPTSIRCEHAGMLSTMRNALAEHADLFVYGCDIATGIAGQAFVESLARATGALVQAPVQTNGDSKSGSSADHLGVFRGAIRASVSAARDWAGSPSKPARVG